MTKFDYDFSKPTPLNKLIAIPFWIGWGVWIAGVLFVEYLKREDK